jgi:NAD(P)-dependent dehydrogenase (short-subunit alcohol dehydrogenase family)
MYLSRKHAIITGGGRGIGAAIAEELARLGASLTLMGRTREPLDEQATRLAEQYGTEVAAVECDVSDPQSIDGAFAAACSRLGDAYVLVNNAGQADSSAFSEMPPEMWHRLLTVNLTGPMLCTQKVLPAMLSARAGRVVNIASTAGLKGYNRLAAYCASKHGLIGLTRSLALETAKRGITVNAVCPSYTDTDMSQAAIDSLVSNLGKTPEEALQMIVRVIPRGVLTRPEEVAHTVGWLCAPQAAAVTGQAIAVAGGEVM